MSELRDLGARVREHRERRGLTQEELADRAGMHRTFIGGVERGERNISYRNLLRIARALEVEPAELLPAQDHV